MSINHIISMGGYGAYVWSAYCITLTVFCANLFVTFREKRRVRKIIRHYFTQLANQHES